MRNNSKLIIVFLCAYLSAFTINANAELYDNGDWTTDTETGLDWLDLTITSSMSYDHVLEYQICSGCPYKGWYYATPEQIGTFWSAFGGASPYVGGRSENNGLWKKMAPLVGDLFYNEKKYPNSFSGEGYSRWLTAEDAGNGKLILAISGDNYLPNFTDYKTQDYFHTKGGTFTRNNIDIAIGSALIRKTPTGEQVDFLDKEELNVNIDSIVGKSAIKYFKDTYSTSPKNKAYAQSKSGQSGMATNMTSAELAAISALIRCQAQNRKKEELYPCRVLNINDDWNTKTITTRDDNSFEADPIIRNNALASFENDYAKATDNKAFSQSDTGVWNWSANNTSTIFAARSALIGCQASNSYFESIAPCKVIRINNAWNKGKISVEESKLGTHSIIQNKGLVSYHDSYANKQNHKAFVQSDKGIWSWSSQKSSQQIAVDSALAVCRKNNTDFEALAPCKILNVDGKWGLHSQFIVPEIEMVNIKEGCFQMGTKLLGRNSPIDERQHKVCVEEFSIGKYEITQGLWEAVMEKNPSRFKNGIRYPVESITWKKANEFIHRLNEMIGKQYRLPTEAEWEYAARGGTTTVFYTGDDIRSDQENIDGTTLFNIDDFREANPNNAGIARKSTVKVGSFSPNPWGLYDVLGNVSEYTCSKYDKNYNGYEEVCSFNSDDSTNELVRKGGSFYGSPSRARSAFRSKTGPGNSSSAIGFRLAHD